MEPFTCRSVELLFRNNWYSTSTHWNVMAYEPSHRRMGDTDWVNGVEKSVSVIPLRSKLEIWIRWLRLWKVYRASWIRMCSEWKANERTRSERKVIWEGEAHKKPLISMQVTAGLRTGVELQKWKPSQLIYQNNRDIKPFQITLSAHKNYLIKIVVCARRTHGHGET